MLEIDIVGPCPITENNNEYIIVMVDYSTKWTEGFSVPNRTALPVADKLVTEFFCRFKIVKTITDDTYRIQKSPEARPLVVHVDHLKPYYGETPVFNSCK